MLLERKYSTFEKREMAIFKEEEEKKAPTFKEKDKHLKKEKNGLNF